MGLQWCPDPVDFQGEVTIDTGLRDTGHETIVPRLEVSRLESNKMDNEENIVRIDKWLWAARLFKTRSLAADAIKGGKVKVDGNPVKPSREVKEGDVIQVQIEQLHKVVQVKTVIKNRVSAKQVPEVYNDLTPKEEYERIEFMHAYKAEWRDRGAGRPTKKERRMIEKMKDDL